MRRLFYLLLLLLCALPVSADPFANRPEPAPLGAPLNNSNDFLPVHQAFRLELTGSTPEAVELRFIAAEGYYLYRHTLSFSAEPDSIGIQPAQLPPGQRKTDEFFGEVDVYYGILDIRVPISNPGNQPFKLNVRYQGCADKGLCYPPETRTFDIGDPPSHSWDFQEIAGFFLLGLLLAFTPCVLPMLPILSAVVLRGQPGGLRAFSLSLAYVIPMALVFALLGVLMGLFGAGLNLQARLQSPWILVPFALFFALFALAMFGLFELRLPRIIREPLDALASKTHGGSLLSAALLGVLSSLLVSPCVSAPLVGALLYISATGDALGGGLRLLALGLGMGAPLIIFISGGSALLPRSGPWMVMIRNAFGVLLLAVAIWLLDRVLPGPLILALWGLLAAGNAVFLGALELTPKTRQQKLAQLAGLVLLIYALAAWVGALRGASDPFQPLAAQASTLPRETAGWRTLTTVQQLEAALSDAQATSQPLLLDWYADWCISCKRIERNILHDPQVMRQLKPYRLVRFDITAGTTEQRALLDRYALVGPPAIQFFSGAGTEWKDLRVVGEIDVDEFLERLQQAGNRR